jgi:hypothetical protein
MTMRDAIAVALMENFDVCSANLLADHVMRCVPPGTIGAGGHVYVGSWLSVFSNEARGCLSVQMHKIGHNLNLAHASELGACNDHAGMASDGRIWTASILCKDPTLTSSHEHIVSCRWGTPMPRMMVPLSCVSTPP